VTHKTCFWYTLLNGNTNAVRFQQYADTLSIGRVVGAVETELKQEINNGNNNT